MQGKLSIQKTIHVSYHVIGRERERERETETEAKRNRATERETDRQTGREKSHNHLLRSRKKRNKLCHKKLTELGRKKYFLNLSKELLLKKKKKILQQIP